VLVVGGEEDQGDGWEDLEETPPTRQFSSVLVYDAVECVWRPEGAFPSMPTPRTAMALCVGLGRASYTLGGIILAGQVAEGPPLKRRRSVGGSTYSEIVDHVGGALEDS
jgi:hypothetical protein